ncbi:hypothetical protein OG349_16790 [Streptomyces sp. NBC_01317]|uniref:hypothetical protein n=1 Tax=Streptomyces sp. NBC_01317 TaxID=2903822 RepID=UPI002E0E0998|nr:hypothetical protein OG349_16790 [Streptomyces sp. NBC_01317]
MDVHAGLERLRAKAVRPGTVPSLVNEIMNGSEGFSTRAGFGASLGGHWAWTSPVDPDAYFEEL